MTFRIAFASAPMAAAPTWTTLNPQDVMQFEIKRGRQFQLNRIEAGQATIVLYNDSGKYWPDKATGPFSGNIKPGKRVNIRATYNAITYDLFTGFIDTWTPAFVSMGGKGPIIVVRCLDLQNNMARYLLNNAGEAQELSGTRVGNVLDEIGWPAADRDLDAGQGDVIATGVQANINSMEHLFTVQDTELGIVFVKPNGYVEFQDRHARVKSPYYTSQATFGDDPAEESYVDLVMDMDSKEILNDVRITRSGGTEQAESDATSQTDYGKRSLSRTGLLMPTNLEASYQARHLLSLYKDAAMRVRAITIRPQGDPASLWPKVLTFDLSTRITLRFDPAAIDWDYHLEGITHKADAVRGTWETRWELSNADSQYYWALGVVDLSELGETTRLMY